MKSCLNDYSNPATGLIRAAVSALALTFPCTTSSAQTSSIEDWSTRASEIAARYEGSSFGSVTPDFDCQGLSLGKSQYAFAQGSVGEFFRRFTKSQRADLYSRHMPNYGEVFAKAVELNIAGVNQNSEEKLAQSTRLVQELQLPKLDGACKSAERANQEVSIIPEAQIEISALLSDPVVVEKQNEENFQKGRRALKFAACWAKSTRGEWTPNFVEFAFFFDFLTQNGARWLSNSQIIDSARLIDLNTTGGVTATEKKQEKVDNLVEWLKADWQFQYKKGYAIDAKKNAELLKQAHSSGKLSDSNLRLLYLAFLRANLGRNIFSYVVFNRRLGIVLGKGHLNTSTKPFDFSDIIEGAEIIKFSEVEASLEKYRIRKQDLCEYY